MTSTLTSHVGQFKGRQFLCPRSRLGFLLWNFIFCRVLRIITKHSLLLDTIILLHVHLFTLHYLPFIFQVPSMHLCCIITLDSVWWTGHNTRVRRSTLHPPRKPHRYLEVLSGRCPPRVMHEMCPAAPHRKRL